MERNIVAIPLVLHNFTDENDKTAAHTAMSVENPSPPPRPAQNNAGEAQHLESPPLPLSCRRGIL